MKIPGGQANGKLTYEGPRWIGKWQCSYLVGLEKDKSDEIPY